MVGFRLCVCSVSTDIGGSEAEGGTGALLLRRFSSAGRAAEDDAQGQRGHRCRIWGVTFVGKVFSPFDILQVEAREYIASLVEQLPLHSSMFGVAWVGSVKGRQTFCGLCFYIRNVRSNGNFCVSLFLNSICFLFGERRLLQTFKVFIYIIPSVLFIVVGCCFCRL